jgi:23S rRNA maturation-related 3'-5' exoribonuclease YhaM
MKLSEAPTADILREIKKFQNAQKRYPATSEIHADIGKQLAPLFAEMARRTAKKEG